MIGCFNRSVLARPDDVPPVPPSLGANATRISANALPPAAHMCHVARALGEWPLVGYSSGPAPDAAPKQSTAPRNRALL